MRGSSCEFYGDNSDLRDLLEEFVSVHGLRFVETLGGVNEDLLEFANADEFLAEAAYSAERPKAGRLYYAVKTDADLVSREIEMADGSGTKLSLDMIRNPDAIGINLGGVLSDQRVVRSTISTFGETAKSREIFKALSKTIRAKAQRLGPRGRPYIVLPGAVGLLKEGWRLVITPEAPPMME